jgi:hypothetical protein
MRQYLFRGIRIDTREWVEGLLCYNIYNQLCIQPIGEESCCVVVPRSVGQYTDMNEFVITDRSFNKPLFEGDIVEVWSRRRQPTENMFIFRDKPTSKYDVEVKARAVVHFKNGEWSLDYDNNYNKALCELRGNEQYERTVAASTRLYDFGFHYGDEDWHREHNARCKYDDIVKIGTEFENSELLEG